MKWYGAIIFFHFIDSEIGLWFEMPFVIIVEIISTFSSRSSLGARNLSNLASMKFFPIILFV